MRVTEDNLQQRVQYWQKRLRLMDWLLDVRLVRHYELDPDCNGKCAAVLERKEATIYLLCEEDRADSMFPSSVDHTLVHEMLHLHFESYWDEDKKTEMEQTINLLSYAFVEAK